MFIYTKSAVFLLMISTTVLYAELGRRPGSAMSMPQPTVSLAAPSQITIEDIEKPTARDAGFVANAIQQGEFIEVVQDGGQTVVKIIPKPEIKQRPGLALLLLEAMSQLSDDPDLLNDDDERYLRETKDAKVSEELFAKAQEASTLATAKLLAAMLASSDIQPDVKETLLGTAKQYLAAYDKIQADQSNRQYFMKQQYTEMDAVRDRLRVAVLAQENNLAPAILDQHPDLLNFLKTNNIGEWSRLFHAAPVVKAENGQVFIRYNNDWQPWENIKASLIDEQTSSLKDHVFVQSGFIPGSVTERLNPLQKEKNPDGKYYFEEVRSHEPDHQWIRLVDSDGTVYSIGWLGKGTKTVPASMHSWTSYLLTPVFGMEKASLGAVVSPDPAELAPQDKIFRNRREVSQQQFAEIVKFLQAYQANPNACYSDKEHGERERGAQGTCDPAHFVEIIKERLDKTKGPFDR